jgi:hypothetical protein
MKPTLNPSSALKMPEAQVLQSRASGCAALNPTIFILVLIIAFGLTSLTALAGSESSWVHEKYQRGDFKLVYGTQAADILISPEDFKVVKLAANDLATDVWTVTGQRPAVQTEAVGLSEHVVLAGTIGKSPLIDTLISKGLLDVRQLRGQWESFLIATVRDPLPNVRLGLVIVGSDRRGTAYGIYELSQAIGVSPWHWWADVTPEHRASLLINAGARREGPPSVQYRGIFLNDEDWGLQPWAAKTFEPEVGDIGPKTYARIFELLLRLKANTLWPAMHECTRAFNLHPENKLVADDYAIIMGSSHAEPMLRNNVTEWTGKKEDYDYTKNAEGVRRYWEERVTENGRFENIYTLGMRGIHDSPIVGPKTQAERIKLLEQIFADQRAILAKHVNPDVNQVPQIFCPYKEVLADYRNGLKVPDDVTIVWPDDNFGYIRSFPSPEEQKRAGGFGVYYHISYLGRPLSYLWLETTPPALIWEEMSKAYDNGVRKFWMVNVGDLKPGEIGTEFFLQMAWDISRWRRDNLQGFLKAWARREFGTRYAAEIAEVLDEYYRLCFARKPEHLQWYLPGEKSRPSDLTSIDYGDEVQTRLDAYDALMMRANHLQLMMPDYLKDAFYELVTYPVRGAALANRRFFMMEKSAVYAAEGRASARRWAERAESADRQILAETMYYNEKLAGGKWRHMMTSELPEGQWPSMRIAKPVPPPVLSQMNITAAPGLGIAIEGRLDPLRENEKEVALPTFNVFTRDTRFIDVFNLGRASAPWLATANQDWINLSRAAGTLGEDARIHVSIDWARAPRGLDVNGTVKISGAGVTRTVAVHVFNLKRSRPQSLTGFVESGGTVSIEAEDFSDKINRAQGSWQVIPGLGRTGDSVAVFPTNAPTIEPARIKQEAPALEYRLQLFTRGKLIVTCYLVPTHPLREGFGLRYGIGFDDQTPQIVTVGAGLEIPSGEWSRNVLNNTTTGTTALQVAATGAHVLKIYMIDPGVVLDKIVIDSGGVRHSYLGPGETKMLDSSRNGANHSDR